MGKGQKDVSLKGKELVDLVESAPFRFRLAEAARITNRTGHETAFFYQRDLEKGHSLLTPIFEGQTDQVDSEALTNYMADQISPEVELFRALAFHFHPNIFGLDLSHQDLDYLDDDFPQNKIYKERGRPITVVGTVDDLLQGFLLFMQKSFFGAITSSSVMDELWKKVRAFNDIWPHPDFGRYIEIPGYVKAEVLKFSVQLRSRWAKYENLEPLYRFAQYKKQSQS